MGRSFIDHSFGTMRGHKVGPDLAHAMIDVEKQCRLKEENQCRDKTGKVRQILRSNRRRVANMQIRVEVWVHPPTRVDLVVAATDLASPFYLYGG